MRKPADTVRQTVRGDGFLDNLIAKLRHRLATLKLRHLQNRNRCLDIGCGNYPAFLLQSDFREKYGIEKNLSPAAQEIAKEAHLILQEMDIENAPLPYEKDFFDAVTALAVIEHLHPSTVPVFLKEVRRVLRPGGVLVLTTPASWTDGLLRLLAGLKIISKEEIDDHKDLYPLRKTRSYLQDAGFLQSRIQCGYFECFMNTWACAEK